MDFSFDGKKLSDYGFVPCTFDGNSQMSGSIISQINFNTFKSSMGNTWKKTNLTYDAPLSKSIQICKNPCLTDDFEITESKIRELQKWLCRKSYKQLYFIEDLHIGFYKINEPIKYNVKIDMSKILFNEKCVGLQLDIITDAPYGWVYVTQQFDTSENHDIIIDFESDDSGYSFYQISLNVLEDGDLTITNNNIINSKFKTSIIKNCKAGNSILIDGNLQQMRPLGHADDFNYVFPRLYSADNNTAITTNKITISLACKVVISYKEARKVGI